MLVYSKGDYVDVSFGTGCLKVTPAHDVNDYLLGEKYNLPSIDIFHDDGTIALAGQLYVDKTPVSLILDGERDAIHS